MSSTGSIAGSVSLAVIASDRKSMCKQFQLRLLFQSDEGLFVCFQQVIYLSRWIK